VVETRAFETQQSRIPLIWEIWGPEKGNEAESIAATALCPKVFAARKDAACTGCDMDRRGG